MSELFSDWRRPTIITSLNPGMLGYERLLKNLHPRVELVEVRLDGAWAVSGGYTGKKQDLDRVENLLRQAHELSQRPIAATFRTEGGKVTINAELYEHLVLRCSRHAAWVDVESNYPRMGTDPTVELSSQQEEDNAKRVMKLSDQLHRNGAGIIMSRHSWHPGPQTTAEVTQILLAQFALGADVSKIACSPQTPTQLHNLRDAGRFIYLQTHRPTIVIGMGELGRLTRIAGPQEGNWGTFVTAGGPASAPGQLPLAEIILRYPGQTQH